MRLELELLKQCSEASQLSANAVNGAVSAAHRIFTWATEDNLQESEAAPVVTEAIARVVAVLHTAECQVAHPISQCTLLQLRDATQSLQRLMQSNTQTESSNLQEAESSSKIRLPTDHRPSSLIANLHIWIVVLVLFLFMAGGTAAMCVIASQELQAYVEQSRHSRAVTLLGIAIDALDALYPFLQQAGVDIQLAGMTIAAAVLEEMSSATTTVDSEQTLFFNANDPLFEYRAGKQNFVQRGRVTAVTTQRTYGRLCTSNYSYLLHPTAQLSGAITEVFVHDLTPNRCVNDAGVSGVFRTVTPPYIGYAGYVQTYRTTSATVATFHHHNYDTSVAVTLDHNSLKNELKRYQSVLGFGDLFSEDDEAWRRRMGRWIALILTCAAFIAVSAAELIPFCRTQLHRAIVAVLMFILVGGTLAFVRVMVERTINIASKEVQLDGARLLARCLAAAMTSTTLNSYSTVNAFLENVANGALESRMFTLHSSSKEPDSVYPSNMQHVAAIINSTNLAAERVVLQNGFHRSHCYASFFDISNDRFAVYVEPEDYQLRIRGALWIAAGAGLISFFFVYAYLRLSPLNRLACAGRGSPLLQRFIAPQHLRYVLYLMMLVIAAGAMIALNAYGASLVNAATEQLSKETLQVLGSTIRSPSLVDNCIGSCGLPSTVVMQRFVIDETKATAVESRVPYPMPAGDWEGHYYGAQLAMSKLPTVLEGMLSFSTPLVNRTSGYIEPRYLQHRMLASVDVNETFGFVLERLPSSTQSPTYAFVSQSIGLCLALGAVCIGVCVLEWLYTRMGRLQRERKSLLSSYVIMVVVVLLVSSMLMVNVAIMKSEMHRAIEEFATSELTLLSHAARGRLESVMRDGIVDGGPSRELLETLVAVARNMSYSVQAGTSILARWCISLEVGANGLMRVWCGDDSINGSRVILPRVLLVDVPVCEVVADKRLGHRMNKFACLAQLRVPNDGEAARVGRIFLVIWREYDDVVTSPSKHGWLNLLKASIVGWVFVTVALLLVLWWTMSTAHMTEFVFLATGERMTLTRALVLPTVGMAERWLPWRFRVGWLMISAMAMLLVLWYLSVFGSYLMRQVHEVEEVDVVYETQDDLAVAMVTALTASAYSFIIYPDRKLLSGSFSRATASESPTTYNFISESRRSDFWGVADTMKEALLSDNVMLSYLPSTFVSTGVDSSQSLIAMAYSDYVTHQKQIMEWMKSITTAIQFFTRTEDNFTLVKVPPALFSCSRLSSLLRKLFILDHISVASYVDFSGKRGANARWPFKVLQDANEIVQAISVASSTIASTIDMEMQTLRDCIDDLMQTSVEADDVHRALEKVRSSYADSCAIYTPSASIWNIQDFRCFEASIIGNRTIMVRDHLQLEALHEELTAAANTMTQLCADDVQQRSNVQLREQILSRSGVGDLVSTLEWERADIARSCRYQSIVMVGCSLPLFLVVVMVSSALLIIQRRAAISSCAVPELMSCLRSESDNMTDKPPTQGSCWGARVLGIGGLLALLPMIAASLLILDFMRHSLVDHVEGMSLDVVQLQTSMIMHIDEYLAHSAIGYSLGTTSEQKRIFGEIVDDVESIVFSMRTLRGSSTNALVIEATGRMQQLVRTAQSIFMTEMDLYKSQTFLYEQIPYHDPLSFYARQVLLTMTPEDNYSILLPMGVTGVGVVPDFAQNLYSNSANPEGVDAIDTYAQQLISLDGASKAYLNMWHVAVTAAAKGGESIAATYWDFESLVGTDALTPLSSSGVASAGAAVTAITTFFAPLLAVSTTKDAVETLFTTTDAPTNETGSVSAYLNAAYVSTYLGSINTSATFSNVYAYNRGLTPTVSQLLAGKPSLFECIREMVATSENLITKGISTSEYTYSIQPAAINTWIWSSELRGAHQSLSVYDDFNYLYLAMQWCCITAVWVVAAACCVIFLRW